MKIVFCNLCNDSFSPEIKPRNCNCGETIALYNPNNGKELFVYSNNDNFTVLAIDNSDVLEAMHSVKTDLRCWKLPQDHKDIFILNGSGHVLEKMILQRK